jgi:hypothetical protein
MPDFSFCVAIFRFARSVHTGRLFLLHLRRIALDSRAPWTGCVRKYQDKSSLVATRTADARQQCCVPKKRI